MLGDQRVQPGDALKALRQSCPGQPPPVSGHDRDRRAEPSRTVRGRDECPQPPGGLTGRPLQQAGQKTPGGLGPVSVPVRTRTSVYLRRPFSSAQRTSVLCVRQNRAGLRPAWLIVMSRNILLSESICQLLETAT